MIQNKAFIPSLFETFRQNQQFIDCVLSASGNKYPAHRILLAKYSNWFKRYFEEHPMIQGKAVEVPIPIDPGNRFSDFLDILYKGTAKITSENIPLLLKLSNFFEVPSLYTIMRKFYLSAIKDDTLLSFVKEFIRLGLIDDAVNLGHDMARKLKDLLDEKDDKNFTKKKFYEAVSPKVLAGVLKDPYLSSYSDSLKVKLIDEYVGDNEITDPSDCEALSSCIDWKQENAKFHLVNNRCNWLPPEISFDLYKKLLGFRRNTIIKLKKSTKEIEENQETSRWYLLSWASKIHDSTLLRDDNPECNVISFIRTVGGMISPINPHLYGLIKLFYSDKPVYTPKYQASNILINDSSYFMSIQRGEKSYIGIDLGNNSHFSFSQASVKTLIDTKIFSNKLDVKKPFIKNIGITSGETEEECKKSQNILIGEASKESPTATVENHQRLPSSRCIAFQMINKNSRGGNVMRIQSIEITGCFSQK